MWPSKWITILGDPGSGKSHVLSALDKKLNPWSLYITSADFEAKSFRATKGVAEYSLEDMLDVISQAPILLYDDFGLEYGKDYIRALIRRVFDFRYRRPTEYITIVTSNLDKSELYETDPRIADRILDNKIGKLIVLEDVASWRRHNGNHK
jgi:DNA replication protein DnaC